MKTVLITGCSSGFGLEIARYFLARDWQVVATMRTPRADVLPPSERLRVLALDVTNPESIRKAVEAAGPIDVLVNNAGFGAASPAELVPIATVRELFETNTFGTIACDASGAASVSAAQGRRRRERHVERDAEGAASDCRVPREQGGGECIHRVDGAGARASSACGCAWCCRAVRPTPASERTRAPTCTASTTRPMPISSRTSSRGCRIRLRRSPRHRTSPKPCGARRLTRHRRCTSRPAPTPKHGRPRFADRRATAD